MEVHKQSPWFNLTLFIIASARALATWLLAAMRASARSGALDVVGTSSIPGDTLCLQVNAQAEMSASSEMSASGKMGSEMSAGGKMGSEMSAGGKLGSEMSAGGKLGSEMSAGGKMGSEMSASSEMSAGGKLGAQAQALAEALSHMSAEAVQARISKYADQVGCSRDGLAMSDDIEEETDLSFLAAHVLRA